MDICCLAPFGFRPKSTTARRVMPMARALARRGHRVLVVVPPYDDPESYGRSWVDARVQVVCLPRPRHDALPLVGALHTQWSLARRAVEVGDQWRPQIVHVFKPKAVSGLAQMFLWRRRNRPAIVLDTDDWEGRAGWSRYEDYPRWMVEVFERQERSGLRRCDAITAASAVLENRARELPRPVDVLRVPNGYDPETFAAWDPDQDRLNGRRALGVRGEERVVLVYTRFFEYSVDRWAAVIREIAAAVSNATFVVLGAGKRGQERELAARIRAAGIGDRVQFLGWVSLDRMPPVLAAADVALLPMEDTLANRSKCSIKYLDLAVVGVPVVATPVGEATTYVRDGDTGYVARSDAPEAVVGAALRALGDGGRPELIARARVFATDEMSWDRLTEPLTGLYELAIARRDRRD